MNRIAHTLHNQILRKRRVRSNITGTTSRPRLSVYISNRHVIAQLVDDTTHCSIGYISTVSKKTPAGTMTERAAWAGTEIAKQAKKAQLKSVVFDRGSHLYHGRVKALADAARAGGLEF
ncbi:MAG TPA: 50S ribosomal protein L18 [Candidatus Saccharimonadales bacterium]|nr:50S ribosomal protein L18 [Candidatus Saccharimonadales bacterium]